MFVCILLLFHTALTMLSLSFQFILSYTTQTGYANSNVMDRSRRKFPQHSGIIKVLNTVVFYFCLIAKRRLFKKLAMSQEIRRLLDNNVTGVCTKIYLSMHKSSCCCWKSFKIKQNWISDFRFFRYLRMCDVKSHSKTQ